MKPFFILALAVASTSAHASGFCGNCDSQATAAAISASQKALGNPADYSTDVRKVSGSLQEDGTVAFDVQLETSADFSAGNETFSVTLDADTCDVLSVVQTDAL